MQRSSVSPFTLGLAFVLLSETASAGWSGSGGRIFNDEGNPWWVQNTPTISYCVAVDEETFGLSLGVVQRIASMAIDYWRSNLAKLYEVENPWETFYVGTQAFQLSTCDRTVDLTFQFGVLTSDQQMRFQADLGDPRDYVAAAVRTSYDHRQMRAQGFVYVAPEDGPLAPSLRNIIPRMWSFQGEQRLLLTVLHELGHVFGVPHSRYREFDENDFMQAEFPETLVTAEAPIQGPATLPAVFFYGKGCFLFSGGFGRSSWARRTSRSDDETGGSIDLHRLLLARDR